MLQGAARPQTVQRSRARENSEAEKRGQEIMSQSIERDGVFGWAERKHRSTRQTVVPVANGNRGIGLLGRSRRTWDDVFHRGSLQGAPEEDRCKCGPMTTRVSVPMISGKINGVRGNWSRTIQSRRTGPASDKPCALTGDSGGEIMPDRTQNVSADNGGSPPRGNDGRVTHHNQHPGCPETLRPVKACMNGSHHHKCQVPQLSNRCLIDEYHKSHA